jgi:hypothetical protein
MPTGMLAHPPPGPPPLRRRRAPMERHFHRKHECWLSLYNNNSNCRQLFFF